MAGEATKIPFVEGSAPATPAANRAVIYVKSDGLFYSKDDAGAETLMSSGASGAMATDALWDAKGDLAAGTGSNTGAKLTAGSNGMVPVYDSAQSQGLKTAYPPGYEFDYATFSSLVSVTGTSEGGANTVIASNSVAYDGATVVFVEFFAPRVSAGPNGSVVLDLYVDSTIQGRIGVVTSPAGSASATPCLVKSPKITPSNASHTFTIKAWRGTADGEVTVGSGGTGAYLNGYIRVVKA